MNGEGCHISGAIKSQKFPGNFHFAPGIPVDIKGVHGHVVNGLSDLKYNFSHEIHELRFGDANADVISPLKGEHKSYVSKDKVYSYYLRLVNSKSDSKAPNGKAINCYEYSATQNTSEANANTSTTGVFFYYDISPMVIERSKKRKSIWSFLINVLSILGGVYAVSSIIDAALFKIENLIAYKRSLGKAF